MLRRTGPEARRSSDRPRLLETHRRLFICGSPFQRGTASASSSDCIQEVGGYYKR